MIWMLRLFLLTLWPLRSEIETASGGMRSDLWPDMRLKPGLPFSLWDPCRAVQLHGFSRSCPVLAGRPRGLDTCHGRSLCNHPRILSMWKLESLRMLPVPSWCAFISKVSEPKPITPGSTVLKA